MDKVPWALWVCALGLAGALNAPSKGYSGPFLALGYLVLLGIVFAGRAAILLVDEKVSFLPSLGWWIVIIGVVTIVVTAGVALLGGSIGKSMDNRWWTNLVDPPANVFGWMMFYLGALWIGWSVYRHHNPGKPIIAVSPEGLAYHRTWLQNLVIPWHEVHDVVQIDPPIGITPPTSRAARGFPRTRRGALAGVPGSDRGWLRAPSWGRRNTARAWALVT